MSACASPFAGAVDADVHVAPAGYEALSPYLDDYFKQYIAEAGMRLSGIAHAYPPLAPTSLSAAARERGLTRPPATYEELRASFLGVALPQIAVLTCVTGFEIHRNPYFTAAVARALNDWLRDEFLSRDPRLRASLVVSTVSTEDAVAEIERVGDMPGFVQVLLPIRSDVPWGHKNFHPIYAAARGQGLQVVLHAWGRSARSASPSGLTLTYLEDYLANQAIAQSQVLSLVAEGVFERFSELRVLIAECGFAWLPALLWRFDKDWKGVWREVPWVRRPPSEYVADHVRFTTAPAHLPPHEGRLDELLEMLGGTDMLVYAGDFPHDHGAGIERLLERLDPGDRAAVLGGTASELYGLEAAAA